MGTVWGGGDEREGGKGAAQTMEITMTEAMMMDTTMATSKKKDDNE
jgi:hypothetical protein